jgi:hypothetical protein
MVALVSAEPSTFAWAVTAQRWCCRFVKVAFFTRVSAIFDAQKCVIRPGLGGRFHNASLIELGGKAPFSIPA